MKSFRIAACLAALALTPALLTACGDDSSSQDEEDITAAIEEAATSGKASICTELQTQNFNEQTSGGGAGEDATKQCQQDAADSPADSVEVENIEVDGDTATADAVVTGSFFDGQTLSLALVKEGDQWKLDEFTGFAAFDREAMKNAVVTEISTEPDVPQGAVDCLEKQFDTLPEEELQAAFVGEEPNAEEKLFGPCFQGE